MIWIAFVTDSDDWAPLGEEIRGYDQKAHAFKYVLGLLRDHAAHEDLEAVIDGLQRSMLQPLPQGYGFNVMVDEEAGEWLRGWVMPVQVR